MAILKFDASQVEIKNDFETIPAGEYLAVIADSEWKENKAKTGGYLNLKIEIIDGKNKGRVIFDMLNLQNQNPKAVGSESLYNRLLAESKGLP